MRRPLFAIQVRFAPDLRPPAVAGWAFDLSGSYTAPMLAGVLGNLLGALVVARATRPRRPA